MTIVYDKRDWHDRSSDGMIGIEASEPTGLHIAQYVRWLAPRDLLMLPLGWTLEELIAAPAEELLGLIDGTLSSDLMSDPARRFSGAAYEMYVAWYDSARQEGSVAPTDDQVRNWLDKSYREWLEGTDGIGDAPTLSSSLASRSENLASTEVVDVGRPAPHAPTLGSHRASLREDFAAAGVVDIGRPAPPQPHDFPDLEAAVASLGGTGWRVTSCTARDWASALLNGRLRAVGIDPRTAQVVTGDNKAIELLGVRAATERIEALADELISRKFWGRDLESTASQLRGRIVRKAVLNSREVAASVAVGDTAFLISGAPDAVDEVLRGLADRPEEQ
ncbi:MAG: hypothetical protein A2V85_00415 [Chloroflexi bacterium RBG_16_72_14]|nr:MAG: hypothetical protein A2V85_00415 [Chloroflexi bacterium RBG_16_72_14]